ncbi:hypothetical protein [Polyangium fumosum]|nr:hypothetical protein [Polyangium fumosum]
MSISCGREEPPQFVLRYEQVAHVEDCHMKMTHAAYHQDPPFVGLKYVCGLPAVDLEGWPKEDPRWTTHPTPPLGFTMSVGDCLLLNETFYCVESVKPGEATFRATFKKTRGHEVLITRIRP